MITNRKTLTEREMITSQYHEVERPKHYTEGKIEVIDFIEDQKLNYHLGNTIKYIARAGKKDPNKYLEDLKKARWYLNRCIEKIEESTADIERHV